MTATKFYDGAAEDVFYRRIDELRALQPGWDKADALPPEKSTIDAAKRLFQRSVSYPVPSVHPTCEGGVQLEWRVGKRSLEIEFEPNGVVSFICWDSLKGVAEDEGEIVFPTSGSAKDLTQFEDRIKLLLTWAQTT